MKLYWSSRSPFVRKVMVVAHELDIAEKITSERVVVSAVKPNTDVMAHNPLAKLPTLILDDGSALYDSRVICEYLASLKPQPQLFPAAGQERWAALRQQARADGLLDTLILWLMERAKPAEQQQAALIEGSRMKLRAVLDAMEKDAGALEQQAFGIGHIATGVALSYVDFRFATENWRTGRPEARRLACDLCQAAEHDRHRARGRLLRRVECADQSSSPKRLATNSVSAAKAWAASAPSASITIVVPIPAASIINPMIDVPPTVSWPRVTRTSAS